jgi:hypothetical protein
MSKKGKQRYNSKVTGIVKKIQFKKGLNKNKVRIISNLLFDGAVYKNHHYSIMYINSSKGLITEFRTDMRKVYGVMPSSFEIIKSEFNTYYRLKYLSKMIYHDLISYMNCFSTSSKECIIPNSLIDDDSYKLILLRAFWENEGSISKSGKLSADLKNFKVINQLSDFHNSLGLNNYISKYWKNGWAYKLILSQDKNNYLKFIRLKLFSKAIVTKGYYKGKKKFDVLRNYIKSRQWLI